MSHSMYTQHKKWQKAVIAAQGPNWHYQVPEADAFMPGDCGVHVCVCAVGDWFTHL